MKLKISKARFIFNVPHWYGTFYQKMHPQYLGGEYELKEYKRTVWISKTKREYPYELLIDGNYAGDFKTIAMAKNWIKENCKDEED